MIAGSGGKMQNLKNRETQVNNPRLNLLEKIWNKARVAKKEHPLIASIMRMTHNALNASASSLLLLDEKNQRLLFKFAKGPADKQLKRFHMNRQSGIAGLVTMTGKPVIVNDVNKNRYFNKSIDEITGFKTKSIICAPLITHGKVIGVIEVLNKLDGSNFSEHDLLTLTGVATTTALALSNISLNENLRNSYRGTINALVSLADAKETSASGHSRRVAEYALMGASELSLSNAEKQTIEYAAILHDIGKLSVPESILNKPEPLTNEEWEIIRKHPVTGYNLLKDIPFLKEASQLILCHHERYDGKGYPCGLKGEAISMGARLIAVADAFDNMTMAHPYRAALSRQDAFTELKRHMRSQFCPVAVNAFTSGFIKARSLSKL
jgi:putative nucleotidyltransferase with HDIG domain